MKYVDADENEYQVRCEEFTITAIKETGVVKKVQTPLPIFSQELTKEIIASDEYLMSSKKEIDVIREYEYSSGQIKFKLGILNKSPTVITAVQISFKIPEALELVAHEPAYEREGRNITIPRIGKNEKIGIAV